MSRTPSTFRLIGFAVLAIFMGGLLLAQSVETDDEVVKSPSDQTAVAKEQEASGEMAEVTSESEVAAANQRDAAVEPAVPATDAAPIEADRPSQAEMKAAWQPVLVGLTIFVLAIFVGFEVITKVPPTLHTPLMSGSNAISGITLVGAVIVAASMSFSGFIGLIAVALATVNAVGGFMVTHRMLAMFKKR
jgi:NAD(P) transhydrogenase subunit alpha